MTELTPAEHTKLFDLIADYYHSRAGRVQAEDIVAFVLAVAEDRARPARNILNVIDQSKYKARGGAFKYQIKFNGQFDKEVLAELAALRKVEHQQCADTVDEAESLRIAEAEDEAVQAGRDLGVQNRGHRGSR